MKIENAYIKNNRLLIHPFNVTSEHKPYFRTNKLYLGFDTKIGNIDQSILNIPLVSSIITYFWMMNKPLEVPVLDEEYVKNLEKLQKFFSDTFDRDFSSELIVKKTVTNTPTSDDSLLFFSGGLDSTYSLYDNLDKHPRMLMICGYDMYMHKGDTLEIREKWSKTYREFAKSIGERITFAYTNTRWLLKEDTVHKNSKNRISLTTYWAYLRHGICLPGLAAPLSDRFGTMITSANGKVEWDTITKENPFGTGANISHLLGYSGIQNFCHGAVDRVTKASEISEWLNSGKTTLRVCYKPTIQLNCMNCKKCLRALAALTAVGVDTEKCGLPPSNESWQTLKNMYLNHKMNPRRVNIHDKATQKYIETHPIKLPEESLVFYDWFMSKDLDEYIEEYYSIKHLNA